MTAVLLLAPLPGGGAVGTALRPGYADVHLERGLQILSEEQYQQLFGHRDVVRQRRHRATATGISGAALLAAALVLHRKRSRTSL